MQAVQQANFAIEGLSLFTAAECMFVSCNVWFVNSSIQLAYQSWLCMHCLLRALEFQDVVAYQL